MTAKEIAEKHRAYSTMGGQRKLVAYNFTPLDFKRFCESLCREQRKLCAGEIEYEPSMPELIDAIKEFVENAPMPDL